jgi:hypothetical protein
MTAYILIVMWSAMGSQTAVTMQEFGSLSACQFASVQIAERKTTVFAPTMVCVPKDVK